MARSGWTNRQLTCVRYVRMLSVCARTSQTALWWCRLIRTPVLAWWCRSWTKRAWPGWQMWRWRPRWSPTDAALVGVFYSGTDGRTGQFYHDFVDDLATKSQSREQAGTGWPFCTDEPGQHAKPLS